MAIKYLSTAIFTGLSGAEIVRALEKLGFVVE
jgi:predicted RNA binding protein YcfA (HicA-like mRNA interferase family)